MIPAELMREPFTLKDARAAGLTRANLRGRRWRRVTRGTYVWSGLQADPMLDLRAALRRLPVDSAFSGLTAAWLHGLDVSPYPVDATVPTDAGVSARVGMVIRRSALSETEVVEVRGVPATNMPRTLADVSSRLSLTEAVVVADAGLHMRRVRPGELRRWIESNSHRLGIRKLRRVVANAEPATESPMESRLRMVLVLGGLPRPLAQVSIYDDRGRFVGRPDLYYEQDRLGIEYDGAGHRNNLSEDNRRQNLLLGAGVRLLRFTAADVMHHPEAVVNHVLALTTLRRLPAKSPLLGVEMRRLPANG